MSAALNIQPDTSNGTHPELSLGSLTSSFSTSTRNIRIPSASSQTTASSSAPLSTPPQPQPPVIGAPSPFTRRKGNDALSPATPAAASKRLAHKEDDPDETDVLNTPGAADRKRWMDVPDSPVLATRIKRTTSASASTKGAHLTLRDQEKHIDNLKKENFSIKLRVHFLEERLGQLGPEHIDAAIKQNINLKIEVQQRGMEMKKLKKLVLELEKELDRLQRGGASSAPSRARERELEEKLEERERELRELRRRRVVEHDNDHNENDGSELRELEARNSALEEQLENARGLLEENMDELERLREIVEQRDGHDDSASDREDTRKERLKRKVEDLEADNDELRNRLEEHAELIAQREEERDDLADEVDALKLEIEGLQRRREAESVERSESRALILEEREEREAVEGDLNALRDKLAAAMIELQQKEDEIEMKNRDIDDMVAEHQRIVEVVEEEWRGEVEEARGQVEELRDVLVERETESKDLRLNISELEANTNELHARFEAELARLEQDCDDKDAEVQAANEVIEKLSDQIYVLEDDNDKLKEDADKLRDEEAAERERLEALSAALKEKVSTLKSQLEEVTDMYETCSQEIHAHRSRQEELAGHVEDLVEEVQRERQARQRAESDLGENQRLHEAELRREQRTLEAKEAGHQNALNELARAQSLLSQRESDLGAVQSALQTLEAESKRAGETHTTARFSLQLEVDRLKRDLERLEDELARARKEIEERESKNRERDTTLDDLHGENREMASQLAAQTQARLNVTEKLETVQGNLKTAEAELAAFKAKVAELEQRLSKDQRSLMVAENQYRDQLTERNTLLLTIYQYMDKILGVDKTPKKGSQAETKPFTNFGVFHDNLITRLKALSQIQLDFDKRCKDVEGRFTEKLVEMRKQLDTRWKQIDKFESSVKAYAETKATWRRKFSTKEGELEALKTTNAELSAQLAGIKRPGQTDGMELRALSARATNSERRLINAQNQLLAAEEKIATMNEKNASADTKWEARVKEYEARLRAAEERVKRERQGGKERVAELENNVKSLQRQFDLAQKRNQQLAEVIDTNKVTSPR